jgi:purine-binding chemotaxis protein CheW
VTEPSPTAGAVSSPTAVVASTAPESGEDNAERERVAEAIVVRLGSGKFAVDLVAVAEVGRVPSVTRVPGLPSWMAGVANWRGRILPVLDVRTLVGADAAPPGAQARLLMLTDGALAVGLLVDAVDGTTELTDVAPFPTAGTLLDSGLLSGQSPREDGPLAIIDVAALLALRQGLPRGRRSA